MCPGLLFTSHNNYGVSDPRSFEGLQKQQGSNIYPMNRLDHEAVRTLISDTNSNGLRKQLLQRTEMLLLFPREVLICQLRTGSLLVITQAESM
jgi:hypothetical protein